MHKLWITLVAMVCLVGCDSKSQGPVDPSPMLAIQRIRQPNWTDRRDHGSCAFATMAFLLRSQGHFAMADRICSECAGPCGAARMVRELERRDVRYAVTDGEANVAFLRAAVATRRGCLVSVLDFYGPQHDARGHYVPQFHAVALVDIRDGLAVLVDSNDHCATRTMPFEKFVVSWCQSYSFAATPVYTPAPPLVR